MSCPDSAQVQKQWEYAISSMFIQICSLTSMTWILIWDYSNSIISSFFTTGSYAPFFNYFWFPWWVKLSIFHCHIPLPVLSFLKFSLHKFLTPYYVHSPPFLPFSSTSRKLIWLNPMFNLFTAYTRRDGYGCRKIHSLDNLSPFNIMTTNLTVALEPNHF